jgi:predicted O-linked N-acetylglucosamine transferase (SPINDLY family)
MTNWLRRLLRGFSVNSSVAEPEGSQTRSQPGSQPGNQPGGQSGSQTDSQAEQHRSAARDALRNKDYASAAKHFQLLVDQHPADIGALTSLAYAERQSGQIEKAISSLTQAAALDETRGEPHYMLSEILRDERRPRAAAEQLELAIRAGSEFSFAYPDLVDLLIEIGERKRAIAACEQAMLVLPASERLMLLRANLATHEHDDETTLEYTRRALELSPGNVDARLGFGLALQRLGRTEEGLAQFERCFSDAPEHVASRFAWVMGHLPACVGPLALSPWDEQPFLAALAWFSEWAAAHQFDESSILGKYLPFLLAYREENHRQPLSQYGALCATLASSWQTKLALPLLPADASTQAAPSGRLRIGLVSPFFSRHSVWHAILKGWIKSIDRQRFELIAFHLSAVCDDETAWARQHVDLFEEQPGDAASWARKIAASRCDALIYGSIGMDELSSQLACLRLAPVQAATWGHPETSGLPTLDYYISGDLFEPADAQLAYSEQLVRLPFLGVNYPLETSEAARLDVTTLGLDAGLPILICPGTPFKYSPLHDQVLVDIARQVEGGQLVFFDSAFTSMANAFRARIEKTFIDAGLAAERCCFVPWMDLRQFHGLMQAADVFVDTIGFSGFNTAIQAIACGLPVVTLEGSFLRGRLAAGVLHRMAMSDLVAPDRNIFVKLVVRLATERQFNAATRERIAVERGALFDDETPVRALEQFLSDAIAAKRRIG